MPGVQRVVPRNVPDGGDGGNLRPALLRLQGLWGIHSAKNYTNKIIVCVKNKALIKFLNTPLFINPLELQRLPPVKLNVLLDPKAEKELAEWKFGLLAVSMGLHNPEL